MSEEAKAAFAAHMRGEISVEIALMRLLLTLGSPDAVTSFLERAGASRLLRLARSRRGDLDRTAQLVTAGLVADRAGLAAVREQFDRAAALSPEAAVALYSLGSPETLVRATAEIVARLQQWRLLAPGIAVLDIGCGIGRLERALSPLTGRVTGIDLSPAMVAEARRRCAGLNNVDFMCGGGADLAQVAGQRFGLILAIDAFPYLLAADPAGAIAARHIADAAALLDAAGALVIFNYSYRGDLARDRAELARLASGCGFVIERDGTRDLALWDGATFLLRKPADPARVSAPPRRG